VLNKSILAFFSPYIFLFLTTHNASSRVLFLLSLTSFFHCIFQTREVIRLQKLQRKLKHASKQSAPPPAVADSEQKLAPSPLCPICANPIRTKQIIKSTAQKTVLKVSSALERRDAALAYKVEQWLTANNASPSASNLSMSANINE